MTLILLTLNPDGIRKESTSTLRRVKEEKRRMTLEEGRGQRGGSSGEELVRRK